MPVLGFMYALGIDIGSSSVKVSLLELETGLVKAAAQSPDGEMPITALKPGYAEQQPEMWWKELIHALGKVMHKAAIDPAAIQCIGITYQMHGLVLVDPEGNVVRPSIIWCDSRAVDAGNKIESGLGRELCYSRLLNLPGNFTASKLKWVQEYEPALYKSSARMMLPGDWIAYKMTGEITTTITGLSEGALWDFSRESVAGFLLEHLQIPAHIIPPLVPVFGAQGKLSAQAASELGLKAGIPITYRSGDQPNNAFSLNVLEPGEVAATAGTSGVVYAVTDSYDPYAGQGVNAFAHVNHQPGKSRLGILLCINGTGIANSWVKKLTGNAGATYETMNREAATIAPGSEGLTFIPFGNGAERMLGNCAPGASLHGVGFNIHQQPHIFRAVQEGIAFSFFYGMKKMQQAGVSVNTLKAGKANLFQSALFTEALAAVTGCRIELYDTDGAAGAARGAALGAGYFNSPEESFKGLSRIQEIQPATSLIAAYIEAYTRWEKILEHQLNAMNYELHPRD